MGRILPIVGMVVLRNGQSGCPNRWAFSSVESTYTISPSLSLYKMVVFPAASRPTIKILISFFPHSLSNSFENVRPMVAIQLTGGVVIIRDVA